MRYVNFGQRDPRFPAEVRFGEVEDASFQDVDFIFVTGSSTNHLYSNINTMYSLILTNSSASIVFVDFGLDDAALSVLVREMKVMLSIFKRESHAILYYRKFNFAHFPDWWSIHDVSIRGGYSWKVISYSDVLDESRRIVIWSDGGNRLPRRIDKELGRVREYGLFTPYSGGSLQSWMYPTASSFMVSHHMLRKMMLGKGMCTGGYLFINYVNDVVMEKIIEPLVECAYTRKCISPYGSSRKNHRQDQAILTALVHSARIPKSCSPAFNTGVRYRQECTSDEDCKGRRDLFKEMLHVQCVCLFEDRNG